MNVTFEDVPTYAFVGENGTFGFGMSGGKENFQDSQINSINNHPVGSFLRKWFNFFTDDFRPSSGFHADLVDDSLTTTDKSLGAVCTGIPWLADIPWGYWCCERNGPCKEGAGNCVNDTECAGQLLCGHNNCDLGNPGFHPSDDCCYWPGEIVDENFREMFKKTSFP